MPTHIVLIYFKSTIVQATIAYSAQEAGEIIDIGQRRFSNGSISS